MAKFTSKTRIIMKLMEIKKDLYSTYFIFIYINLVISIFIYYFVDPKHSIIINNLVIKPELIYVLFSILLFGFILIADMKYSFDFELYEDKIFSINSITKNQLEFKFIEIEKIVFINNRSLIEFLFLNQKISMIIHLKNKTIISYNFDFYSDEKNEFLKKLKELEVNVEIMI